MRSTKQNENRVDIERDTATASRAYSSAWWAVWAHGEGGMNSLVGFGRRFRNLRSGASGLVAYWTSAVGGGRREWQNRELIVKFRRLIKVDFK